MRRNIKRFIKKPFLAVADYLYFIFGSAAENHIRLQKKQDLQKDNDAKFPSYYQFKRYQKKSRRVLLLLVLFALGMLVSQLIFPSSVKTEVAIPEGEGDILISNLKNDGATVVFKTLDAANFNKPLATTAVISIYKDPQMLELVKVTDPDDYAVTHLISLNGLENERDYYLKIKASDSSESGSAKSSKEIFFAPGKENYLHFRTGNNLAQNNSCEEKLREIVRRLAQNSAQNATGQIDAEANMPGKLLGDDEVALQQEELQKGNDNRLQIENILHETALYDLDKVQAIVSWHTNKSASTTAIYREGKGGEAKEVSFADKVGLAHMAVFTNFKPGTVYFFKVKSVGENGETAISEEFSFLTPKKKEGIGEVIVNNFKQLFKQMLPTQQ